MVWSKIKKAINSTLGTSGFKPLDKIVEDSFSEVVARQNEIKNALESGENDFIVSFAKSSANIEIGTYYGTDTYGVNNRNSLTFTFDPKIVIIASDTSHYEMTLIFGRDHGFVAYRGSIGALDNVPLWAGNSVTWDEKTVHWYNTKNEEYQLNEKQTYRYVAIG